MPSWLGLYNFHYEELAGGGSVAQVWSVESESGRFAMLLSTGLVSAVMMSVPLVLFMNVRWLQRCYVWAMLPMSFFTLAAQVVMYREFGTEINYRVMGLFQGDIATLWVYAQKEYHAGVVFLSVLLVSILITRLLYRFHSQGGGELTCLLLAMAIVLPIPLMTFLWKRLADFENYHPSKVSFAPVLQVATLTQTMFSQQQSGYKQILQKAGPVVEDERAELSKRLGRDSREFVECVVEKPVWLKRRPTHVFMFLLESYDYDLLSEEGLEVLAPHLNFYNDTGLSVPTFMASGFQTIDAVHSICAGSVMQRSHPRLAEIGRYKLDTLPKLMDSAGYKPLFYAASFRKFLSKGDTSEAYGYRQFLGCDEIPTRLSEHEWGVSDGEFFDWVEGELSDLETSHFVTFLNVSNHGPYEAPVESIQGSTEFPPEVVKLFAGTNQEERMKYAKHVLYADEQVDRMVKYLHQKYPNALFVFTGDHKSWKMRVKNENSVPFILWNDNVLDCDIDTSQWFGSHMDVLATLTSLVLEDGERYKSLGRPVWSLDVDRISLGGSAVLSPGRVYERGMEKKYSEEIDGYPVYWRASAIEALSWGYTHLRE